MQDSEVVLNSLNEQAKKPDYVFQRLYRIFYNPDMYHKAYANIYANDGSSTPGIDGATADGFGNDVIERIIAILKDESYQPKPVRRTYIPKKNGKKRPLGIPTFTDRIVQEICRMILEAIYEPVFLEHSHGFRPNRSPHTALEKVQKTFTSINWFIEGDIKGFFDNIDHHVLVEILRKKIADERFIRLIWKFLRAGYLEDFTYQKTYSGTPQGGIVSPILANIYLNEFDWYVMQLKKDFDNGTPKQQQRNPEYRKLERRVYRLRKQIDASKDDENKRLKLLAEFEQTSMEMRQTPYHSNPNGYKSLKYVRYADDFLIGVNGSKEDCLKLKEQIRKFLCEKLHLELSIEKTLITHSNKSAKFLSYEITIGNTGIIRKVGNHYQRCATRTVRLIMPKRVMIEEINSKNMVKDINAHEWRMNARPQLINLSDLEIVSIYNDEIRGLYNYYRMAENVSKKMWQYRHVAQLSCLKTLANKHKCSVKKIADELRDKEGWGVKYQTKEGQKTRYFYKDGFAKSESPFKGDPDPKPNTLKYMGRTELERRMNANVCEWCGREDKHCEVHHVHRLKDLKGKEEWKKLMIARKRKTLILCRECHRRIAHAHH